MNTPLMHRPALRIAATISAALGLALLGGGCSESRNDSAGGKPRPQAKLRKVIGQTTQDIKNLEVEQQQNPQAQVASRKITAKDPITLQGNAYVTAVGTIAIQSIDYSIRLYEAEHGRYPKDYDEFMNDIIRANNIVLPQLPGYQEYAYDPKTHKLLVLEYPDRREELKRQVAGGR